MPKIAYITKKFSRDSLAIVVQAEAICQEYAAQGFVITLRQLYYQFVSRGLLANKQAEYKRLGGIVNDARLAGYIDWDHLEDRTRNLQVLGHWGSPASIISAAAQGYRIDKWSRQPYYVEVWIEKDALVGVIEGVCNNNDVPFFSCRGYTSQSEMWIAAQRLLGRKYGKEGIVILHLGDHDPSGIDMSRDIEERLKLFLGEIHGADLEVRRIALTMDQVDQYTPPPNPAKVTDSRFEGYSLQYGDDSWELDALDPTVLAALIQDNIDEFLNDDLWAEAKGEEDAGRDTLDKISRRWSEVNEILTRGGNS